MNWLIDAQLPRRLGWRLAALGHDVIHTLDLPLGNRTPDSEIIAIAEAQGRVVITKDTDFVDSYLLFRRPPRLLLIATGNIANTELESLLLSHLETIVKAFETHDFLEVNRAAVMIRQ